MCTYAHVQIYICIYTHTQAQEHMHSKQPITTLLCLLTSSSTLFQFKGHCRQKIKTCDGTIAMLQMLHISFVTKSQVSSPIISLLLEINHKVKHEQTNQINLQHKTSHTKNNNNANNHHHHHHHNGAERCYTRFLIIYLLCPKLS